MNLALNLSYVMIISDRMIWLTLLEGFLIFHYLKIGHSELYEHMQNINYKVHATHFWLACGVSSLSKKSKGLQQCALLQRFTR